MRGFRIKTRVGERLGGLVLGNRRIPIQPLRFWRGVEDEFLAGFGRGAHGGAIGGGEGNLAGRGEVRLGLDSEFQNAHGGFEPARVPESGIGPDELVVFAIDHDAEDDLASIAGKIFLRDLADGDTFVKDLRSLSDRAVGRGQENVQAGRHDIVVFEAGNPHEGIRGFG